MEGEQVHLAESRGYLLLDFNHPVPGSRTKESDSNHPEPRCIERKNPPDDL